MELLLVQSMVAQNGGYFRCIAEGGSARQVEILLPSIGTFHGGHPEDSGAGPTVLLAEEEDGVRRMMRGCLVRAGYAVLEARSEADAEALARLHEGPIDVLATNAPASGNSGTQLAERLRQLWPDLRTLLITGYRHDGADSLSGRGSAVLSKPFVGQELLRRVRILLEPEPVTK